MTAVLDGIRRNEFLIIGRVGMDFFAHPPGTRAEHGIEFRSAMGGSSANIAAGLVKLGSSATLVTCVSNDTVGRYCLNQLDRYGVDRRYVRSVDGGYRTSLAVYESTIEDHQTVIYRNGAADFEMTPEDIDAVDFRDYGALITAGTVFASEPSRSATFHAFDRAREHGLPIIFDVDYRPYSWTSPEEAATVLSRAGAASDVIVGNDEEFGFMAGNFDDGLEKARELAADAAHMVVYKMGERGSITLAGGCEFETGVYAVDALKPEGAGDSFMAGVIASLAAGHSIDDSVKRGSACAAIVVSKPGCSPAMPYPDELEAFLAERTPPAKN